MNMTDQKKEIKDDELWWTLSRRGFCKTTLFVILGFFLGSRKLLYGAEEASQEPENLDEPTTWQEGDPKPVEMTVPTQEPEQTSSEAPPSQPIDDERPDPPDSNHVWASGYWLWTDRGYVWVPGYWGLPPEPDYVYIPGYWTYRSTTWVYVRGGWGRPNTTVVVVYGRPRPVVRVHVIHAPIRIVRRHRHWHHYPHRRPVHRAPQMHRPKPVPRSPGPSPGPKPGTPRKPRSPGVRRPR